MAGVARLLARRQGGRCGRCGLPLARGERLEVDHFIPLAKGGTNRLSNLRLTHDTCNRDKAATLPADGN